MERPEKKLDWFLSEKDKYLIVSFSGSLVELTSSPDFDTTHSINAISL